MPIALVVLQDPPKTAKPKRSLARGTQTALIPERRLRLHAPGDRPWEGAPQDHRQQINVERHGNAYVVYKPSVGAVSALNERDYMAFTLFVETQGDRSAMARYYAQMGASDAAAAEFADKLAERLTREGWTRTERPQPSDAPLQAAYLTVTRYCDLTCPYCYQGLNDRVNTDMTIAQVQLVLDRVKAINPACQIMVAGGEPFTHPHIHKILDMIDAAGFPFVILSNGTFIDEATAAHLKASSHFRCIQISIDGATAETHELTRGKGHFPKVMAAIRNIIAQGLPFKLAPTVHNKNMHEMAALGELAIGNGGWLSPNNLKELPHPGLNYTDLVMSNEGLMESLKVVNDHLVAKFGLDKISELSNRYAMVEPEVCSVTQPNSTFICGMAHALMDIDWNGDVYPCHLSKGPELRIGNIFQEDFPAIFRRVEERGIRVKSHEIEKCSGCKFNSTCAGGCRAGAWFTYGTLEHEDEMCEVQYPAYLRRLLVGVSTS
jgi:radical SAM protein with 4Fe4S-binding SPASM domain